MYFQVSPAHTKQKASKAANIEEEEIPTLTLAPFTQIPKLSFQDVAVNALHEIKLHVVNKKSVPVFVNACFDGPEELEFSQSWCEQRIEANDAKLLEFYWYPNTEYSERHSIKITCLKQMWNVPITFKSVLPKKTKKKVATTLVKKTSPSIRKNARKTTHKQSTVPSKAPPKKQPIWNDKPYIPKKNAYDKENLNINSKSEQFCSSSNISFNISSPDNLRGFTYAVNKLAKEDSPNLEDSLEDPPPHRLALKGIQLNNSTLGEFLNKKLGLDTISYMGTPISQFFKPSRVSSELAKKGSGEKESMENPRVIRNLSFEINCEVEPCMNISSETRIIGNLSSDSLRVGLDGNTFVKNNISTETYVKEDQESARVRYSIDPINKSPVEPYKSDKMLQSQHKSGRNNSVSQPFKDTQYRDEYFKRNNEKDQVDFKSCNSIPKTSCKDSDLNMTSGTYVRHETSFQTRTFDRSSDSFTERLKQLGEHNLSTETYTKEERRSSNYYNGIFRDSFATFSQQQEYREESTRYETGVRDHLRDSFESNCLSRTSPKKGIEVFPNIEALPAIKLNDVHNLFPIKEEPTDESLRRRQIKRKSDSKFDNSPLKRANLSPETWSKIGGVYRTRSSIQRATKLSTPKPKGKKNNSKEESFLGGTKSVIYVEKKTMSITDPFILAATTAVDPFLTNTIYLDQDWIQRQEDRFKNWMNMLLTPPVDLNVSDEGQQIDAAKLWRECSQKEVAAAPTKEEVCIKYHTSSKLDTLRRSAHDFYYSDSIQGVLIKVYDAIEKKKIEIRPDRNVHLDLSLQSKVMTLLLSYNPLWLRIALETIYREKLKLSSNSDLLGLSKFLYERFFKDRVLIRKHKTVHNPKYNVDIKKFMLKKYFSIVYFLDKAKMTTLIPHDPCLFRKNATVKESREMLIQFTRDAITAAVGDITKYLKYFGYFVEHQQTYIHEFDYAVNSLGGDLRDGVRLARVMELILLRNDLTQNLRVPAISRLQKIHNVKLVFESLANAGYQIQHEIEPHHIVEGHREKTLSFLWQIIYKFQAPLVIETARSIQKWWRSLPVCVKRMKLRRQYQAKVEAATKIQRWYRHRKQAEKLLLIASHLITYLRERRIEHAAIKIQSFYRMHKQRKNYIRTRNTIVKLQQQCRLWLNNVCYRQRESAAIVIQKNFKRYMARNRFLLAKHSVLILEKYIIARKLMQLQQQQYIRIKTSIITIQRWYRATVQMRKNRNEYLKLKSAACLVQKRYRSLLLMRKIFSEYTALKYSTIIIQKWYRSTLMMHSQRRYFLSLKQSVSIIEKRYIAQKEMKKVKGEYQQLKYSTVIIQRHLRATLVMRKERSYYLSLKKSVDFVKSKYKYNKLMLEDKKNFINLKKAAILVQRKFRANKLMKIERKSYLKLKESTVIIQTHFRSFLLMKKCRKDYLKLRMSCIKIQQGYRAYKLMCSAKNEYENLRRAVLIVQRRVRANNAMKIQRQEYLREKQSCITIQRYFRSYSLMKKERQEYLQLRSITCFIQEKYRAKLAMKKCQEKYMKLKKVCIMVQRLFRANRLMQQQRAEYQALKQAASLVKAKFLANKKMLKARDEYQRLKKYTIIVQRIYRATRLMRIEQNSYLERKNSTIKIQKFVRGYLLMKKEKQQYLTIKLSVIKIQRKFRAHKDMIQMRDYYNRLKQAVVFVQRKFRANKLMKQENRSFLVKRTAAITIQRHFRSYLLMKKERNEYIVIKKSAFIIQQWYTAYKKMCSEKSYYESLKKAVIIIQIRYRSNKLMQEQRRQYLEQRKSCIIIQRYFRSYLLMKKEQEMYLTLKSTTRFIQEKYRMKRLMKITRGSYLRLRQMVIYVQRKFRANRAMKSQRALFLEQKNAAIKIQQYFRGYQQMKKDRKYFLSLTSSVYSIQRFARGFLTRKKYAHLLTAEAREERRKKKLQEAAATKIQACWRGYQQRKKSNNVLVEIRKRSENATREADPQESLGNRGSRALDMLVTEEITVPLIISALTDFEYVTRRSPEMCLKMGPILPEQLYLLIKSVGRSLPDIKICEISTYILINLFKYEQTRAMTWCPEYLDSMLKIMTHWCDKDNMAFPSLCTLFWLFAHNKEYKETILKLPNANQRIEKIHSMVLRKQKMVAKSESKMVNSRFISKKPLYLPGLKPDWGFDYPTRPRLFMNSVHAIESLIKILK